MAVSNGYTYTIVGSDCTITDYDPITSSHGYDPVIPSTLDGYNVTILGNSAFEEKSLTSVSIASSVTSIGNDTFEGNSLTSLTIPSSVTSIGNDSFKDNSITTITLAHNFYIGTDAFANNTGLTVNMNSNVTCGSTPFLNCSVGANLTISSSVTSIPNDMFELCGLTSLTIPSSVTSIGNGSFDDNSLTSLTIPSNVTSIGYDSFKDNSITTITLAHNFYIGTDAFANNTGLTVNMNSNVTCGSTPFLNCSVGANLTISSSVTSIPNDMFELCGLTSLTIPSSVTSIGNGSFDDNSLTSLTIPSSVTSIGYDSFKDNSITTITLAHNFYIGNDAFANNTGLTINMNSNVTCGLTPFSNCSVGANLTISSSVTTIPNDMFESCGLTSVSIPSSVTSIGNDSFKSNTSLSSVTIYGKTVTFGSDILTNNMSSSPKGVIYGYSGTSTETWAGTWSSTYTFEALAPDMYQEHDVEIQLLEFFETDTAEASTDGDTIVMTSHGLSVDDFIVNTTRRSTSQLQAERGCRRVVTVTDSNTIELSSSITGQVSTDSIRKYKFYDISSYIDFNTITLTLIAEHNDSLTFTMTSTTSGSGISKLPQVGQYVRMLIDDDVWFTGIIKGVNYNPTDEAIGAIKINVNVGTIKMRAKYRSIVIDYDSGEASDDIVNDMLEYFAQEGVVAGTIDSAGIDISEDWANDCISVGEVLDEISEKNGYQWFVDELFQLHFYQEPTSIESCIRTLEDGGTYTDFRNIIVSENLDDYVNKSFLIGGNDIDGNLVYSLSGDNTEQINNQNVCAGSGVYGKITKNSSLTEREEHTAESGTTTTNIKITAHNFSVNTLLRNKTRNAYCYITAIVDVDNVTVTTVASQTTGDIIVYNRTAGIINLNMLKKYSFLPLQFNFSCFDITFKPQQKLYIDLPNLSIDEQYFVIEKTVIKDSGAGYFIQEVQAVLRNNDDFSTQKRSNDLIDIFKNI